MMGNKLYERDLLDLQRYRLTDGQLQHYFRVADLFDDQFLKEFIRDLASSIGAPSEKTAASIFIKRYAFVAVLSLYSMTAWNKKLNVSIDNIKMESPQEGKDWLPLFELVDSSSEDWQEGNRSAWRENILTDLFADNISPIIVKLEKEFNISKLVLWENIAVYLFWLYEMELRDNSNRDQIYSDFRYLIFEADGKVFGELGHNPLQKYYSEKNYLESIEEEVRVRKTCCFTYQLASSTKRCKTCPCTHISKDGRCYDGEIICGTVPSFIGKIQ